LAGGTQSLNHVGDASEDDAESTGLVNIQSGLHGGLHEQGLQGLHKLTEEKENRNSALQLLNVMLFEEQLLIQSRLDGSVFKRNGSHGFEHELPREVGADQ
jgi:hypothetical protein